MEYSKQSTIFLDIQYQIGKEGEKVVKELAFIEGNGTVAKSFSFKPPYSFDELTEKQKFQVKFNERYINGLNWYDGDLDYTKFEEIITYLEHSSEVDVIIVNGLEKVRFLDQYSSKIEEAHCTKKLKDANLIYECMNHTSTTKRCAVKTVFSLLYTYMEQQRLY